MHKQLVTLQRERRTTSYYRFKLIFIFKLIKAASGKQLCHGGVLSCGVVFHYRHRDMDLTNQSARLSSPFIKACVTLHHMLSLSLSLALRPLHREQGQTQWRRLRLRSSSEEHIRKMFCNWSPFTSFHLLRSPNILGIPQLYKK